ncbi:ferredoxin--NADP reductase [Babesia caballi]|uniref:Ferredoxin--NADP reductase n=1 Tax=Babesia caballi TaxID=5871 RepID=A0AAV4LW42_BABCB|nr:ferredoxin--NADP reductase [Babesia caballi]
MEPAYAPAVVADPLNRRAAAVEVRLVGRKHRHLGMPGFGPVGDTLVLQAAVRLLVLVAPEAHEAGDDLTTGLDVGHELFAHGGQEVLQHFQGREIGRVLMR